MLNPTNKPSVKSTLAATSEGTPSGQPTKQPTEEPTGKATEQSTPTTTSEGTPSVQPTKQPKGQPTVRPSVQSTSEDIPSKQPTDWPTPSPSVRPTELPSGAQALLIQRSQNGDYSLGKIADGLNDPKVYGPSIVGVAFLVALGAYIVKRATRQSAQTEEALGRSETEPQSAQTGQISDSSVSLDDIIGSSLDGDDFAEVLFTNVKSTRSNCPATSPRPPREARRFEIEQNKNPASDIYSR